MLQWPHRTSGMIGNLQELIQDHPIAPTFGVENMLGITINFGIPQDGNFLLF